MQYKTKCDDAQIKLFVYFTLFQGSWVSKGLQYLTFLGIGARLLPVNGPDGPRIILQKLKPKPSHSSCWIVMYCSMSHLKNFHSYGDITGFFWPFFFAFDLCIREGSFLRQDCCDTGPRFLRSHAKGCPILWHCMTNKGY